MQGWWKNTATILCVTTVLSLSGCTALQGLAADALLPGNDGVSLDANAGKAESNQGGVAQQANTAVALGGGTASTTFQAPVETVVNDAGLSWWELGLLLLLAGWVIPSPGEMARGLVSFVGSFVPSFGSDRRPET